MGGGAFLSGALAVFLSCLCDPSRSLYWDCCGLCGLFLPRHHGRASVLMVLSGQCEPLGKSRTWSIRLGHLHRGRSSWGNSLFGLKWEKEAGTVSLCLPGSKFWCCCWAEWVGSLIVHSGRNLRAMLPVRGMECLGLPRVPYLLVRGRAGEVLSICPFS